MENFDLARKALGKTLTEAAMKESRKEAGKKEPREEARAVRMSAMKDLPIEWLWPGRIVMENLTLLVGEPEAGKSTVAFDLAARLSRGETWPDGTSIGEPKSTMFVLANDHGSFTVRPALAAAGADMDQIATMCDVEFSKEGERHRRPFELPRDMDRLQEKIQELPNCKLVVIDPILAIVKPASLRSTLRELMMMAGDMHFAVLGLAHLRPGGMRALYRTDGGIALTSAARAVWIATPDAIHEERRLLLPVKNNLVRERTGLAYSVVDAEGLAAPRLAWESEKVEERVDAVLEERRQFGMDADKMQEAIQFLKERLALGPRPVIEVELEAMAGRFISHRTLVRARKAAGVKTFQKKGQREWWMHLPPMGGDGPGDNTDGTVGTVGTLITNAEKNSNLSECHRAPNGTLERTGEDQTGNAEVKA